MNASVSTSRTVRTVASLAILTGALALTACQTDGSGPAAADAPKAQAASVRPESPGAKPETPPTQTARPAAPADDGGEPMTRTRAARECWMRTEKTNPHQDLDRRADIVNKCIDDKLKAAGGPAPKT
jgi:hypothetical protein